ncbi:MAG: DUF924 domain-containing protein [Cohaesibacter sp.]|nr:DUF924 domain-containing protein [Cohaesibacter sp.]MCV6601751.1 DUF924 domain-containing protein [Cohaesibacter sp.]
MTPQAVLDFWFGAEPRFWFAKDDGFDAQIDTQFGAIVQKARQGELMDWEEQEGGLLALIILLDQFSRNLYRGSGEAFAKDAYALILSKRLVVSHEWNSLDEQQKIFAVMPMMHSENLQDQRDCLAHMQMIGAEDSIKYAQIHLDIIEKFGRFPHRNQLLGRQTSKEEQAFLDEGGFAG